MSVSEQRAGCVLLHTADVPEQWRMRAIPVSLVTLLPDEAAQLLAGEPVTPALEGDELAFARLVAKGETAAGIGRALGITTRTVYRRLARLRDRFGVATTPELLNRLGRHHL